MFIKQAILHINRYALIGLFLSGQTALATTLDGPERAPQLPDLFDPGILDKAQRLNIPSLSLQNAVVLIEQGKIEAGLKLANATLAVNPKNSAAHEVRGLALAKMQRFKESLDAFDKATEFDPNRSTAFVHKGILLFALGATDEARTALEHAVSLDPAARRAHQRLGRIAVAQGRTSDAITHFLAGIDGTEPEYVGVKTDLSNIYLEQGEPKKVLDLLGHWSGRLSDAPDSALEVLARTHVAMGNRDQAQPIFEVLQNRGTSLQGLIGLANLYKSDLQFDLAEKTLLKARENFESASIVYFDLGNIYAAQRDYDRAHDVYLEGLEKHPENPALLKGISLVEYRSGNIEDATLHAEKLSNLPTRRDADVLWLATLYKAGNEQEKAIKAYEQVIAISPQHWIARNNLAAFISTSDPARAVTLAQKAADLSGQNPAVMDTLGWAHFNAGNTQKALEIFSALSADNPDDPLATYRLGRSLLAAGQDAKGRDAIKRALTLDPDFKYATEAAGYLSQ